jgi:regulator of nucleoside diphosphate kinase
MMEIDKLILSDQDYARLSMLANDELLGDELSRAIVVPADQVPADVVRINSRVIYLDESSGLSREVELVFPEGADLKYGKISVLSPVGSALLGLKEGQVIDWPFPHGQSRRLKVVSVANYFGLEQD